MVCVVWGDASSAWKNKLLFWFKFKISNFNSIFLLKTIVINLQLKLDGSKREKKNTKTAFPWKTLKYEFHLQHFKSKEQNKIMNFNCYCNPHLRHLVNSFNIGSEVFLFTSYHLLLHYFQTHPIYRILFWIELTNY